MARERTERTERSPPGPQGGALGGALIPGCRLTPPPPAPRPPGGSAFSPDGLAEGPAELRQLMLRDGQDQGRPMAQPTLSPRPALRTTRAMSLPEGGEHPVIKGFLTQSKKRDREAERNGALGKGTVC